MDNNTIKIVIAEDLPVLREGFSDIIKSCDKMSLVKAVETGEDAVDTALNNDIDIILMDVEMETRTAGIDAAKKILEVKPFIKILFLTIHEEPEYVKEGIGLGATDYIIKSDNNLNIQKKILDAYYDKVEFEMKVQKVLHSDYIKIKRDETEILQLFRIISQLTKSEKEIINMLINGNTVKQIAQYRFVEVPTIKKQVGNILKKFNVSRTKEIVKKISELGIQDIFT